MGVEPGTFVCLVGKLYPFLQKIFKLVCLELYLRFWTLEILDIRDSDICGFSYLEL